MRNAIRFRRPTISDGPAVTALIAASPPLEVNSAYCNLLQCSDFADTCIVAERNDAIAGWVSGYRLPAAPDALFVWQVAVSPDARGLGLGGRMLDALVERHADVRRLTTTITAGNRASWALFEGFARRHGAVLERSLRFDANTHFNGAHEGEWQAAIAPLNAPALSTDRQEK
ncbi:MAG: diaminobutyrate acetyltransferase [Sphingomonas bacterium]